MSSSGLVLLWQMRQPHEPMLAMRSALCTGTVRRCGDGDGVDVGAAGSRALIFSRMALHSDEVLELSSDDGG